MKNISLVMHNVLNSSRKRSERNILLLFDMAKAFDTVNRPKLWQILLQRAKSDAEKLIVAQIMRIHSQTEIFIDENESFISNQGVPQGGVLSPYLFNVYLDDAIQNNATLKRLAESEHLLCFADDIIVRQNKLEDAKAVI